jgi:hypothetical protein
MTIRRVSSPGSAGRGFIADQLVGELVFLFCGMMLLLAVLKQSFLRVLGSNQRIEDK